VINFDDINLEKGGSQQVKYGQSKAGNILLASEFARRYRDSGVLSLVRRCHRRCCIGGRVC
jgi:retinol dehydrogenase-12